MRFEGGVRELADTANKGRTMRHRVPIMIDLDLYTFVVKPLRSCAVALWHDFVVRHVHGTQLHSAELY